MPSFSAKKFADLLGVSPQRVSRLIAAGLPCVQPAGRGKPTQIDFREAFDWLIWREIKKHAARDGGVPLAEARRLRAAAEARIAAARATALEDAVIDRSEVVALLKNMLRIVDGHLSALPDELSGPLAEETEPAVIHSITLAAARRVRQRLADDFAAMAAREEAAGDAS